MVRGWQAFFWGGAGCCVWTATSGNNSRQLKEQVFTMRQTVADAIASVAHTSKVFGNCQFVPMVLSSPRAWREP